MLLNYQNLVIEIENSSRRATKRSTEINSIALISYFRINKFHLCDCNTSYVANPY